MIEKCSSPIGDGNILRESPIVMSVQIEKCSSPIGDGNLVEARSKRMIEEQLRNVAPR